MGDGFALRATASRAATSVARTRAVPRFSPGAMGSSGCPSPAAGLVFVPLLIPRHPLLFARLHDGGPARALGLHVAICGARIQLPAAAVFLEEGDQGFY